MSDFGDGGLRKLRELYTQSFISKGIASIEKARAYWNQFSSDMKKAKSFDLAFKSGSPCKT
ncbi:hypothetical protein DS893_02635 [Vibrionales bacterium C3R12]|nr:hypothetical protein DS893_02635 [Vibrionales bacterium C3R12]